VNFLAEKVISTINGVDTVFRVYRDGDPVSVALLNEKELERVSILEDGLVKCAGELKH